MSKLGELWQLNNVFPKFPDTDCDPWKERNFYYTGTRIARNWLIKPRSSEVLKLFLTYCEVLLSDDLHVKLT